MSDQVLTDEEKGALIDGMDSGEVEVQSGHGPKYASVVDFEVPPRCRIVSNSFPRLQQLNQALAARFSKQIEQLLNTEATVEFEAIETETLAELSDRSDEMPLLAEYSVEPLPGPAIVYLKAPIVGQLVESFFGGTREGAGTQSPNSFTTGETNVGALFSDELVRELAAVWESVVGFAPERKGVFQSADALDNVEISDPVITSDFVLKLGEATLVFHVVLPTVTIASLVPIFEGQKRDRDPAEDVRWGHALRTRIVDSIIHISSCVGQTTMTLGQVADLKPGDVIEIDSPRKGTVFTRNVPILEGRFGVHDGRHAIEATNWLEQDGDVEAKAG